LSYTTVATSITATIDLVSTGSTVHPAPNVMDIELALTDAWSTAEMKLDYDDAPSINLNDDVTIQLSKADSIDYNTVFTGKVRAIEKISEGKDSRWLNVFYVDYSKYLFDRIWRGSTIGLASSIIQDIVQPLIDEGKLAGTSINIVDRTIQIDRPEGDTYGDIIKHICSGEKEQIDADWYASFDKTINVFTRGSRNTTVNVADDALSFEYKEDLDRLINKQVSYGAYGKTLGTDTDYTENTTNWSASDTLKRASYNRTTGDYSVACTSTGGADKYLERTFPTTLDLYPSGEIEFDIRFVGRCLYNLVPDSFEFTSYFYTDVSNYYHLSHKTSGGKVTRVGSDPDGQRRWAAYGYAEYKFDFSAVNIPVAKGSGREWGVIGTPSWESITKIKIEVNYPVLQNPTEMWIDNLSILTRYYGEYEDATSQSLYDLKEGKPLLKTGLQSDEACTILCSLIVDGYKDPMINVDNLVTSKNFRVNIGDEAVFDILDIDKTLTVRRIRHNVEDLNLTTELDLSPKHIPEPEEMLATFKHQMEYLNYNLDVWKKGILASAIIPLYRGQIEWWEVNPKFGIFSWASAKQYVIQGLEENVIAQIGTGSYDFSLGNIKLYSGTVTNDYCLIRSGPSWTDPPTPLSKDKTISFGAGIYISGTYETDAKIEIGSWSDTFDSGFGFDINDNLLRARVNNSTGSTILLLETIYPGSIYVLEAHYYPTENVTFFINGDFKATITSRLPDNDMVVFSMECWTGENLEKTFDVYNLQIGEVR